MKLHLMLPVICCALGLPLAVHAGGAPSVPAAGETLQLDKDFSLRLDQRVPSAPLPTVPARPEIRRAVPVETPEGEPLPPGSRALQFNGRTYYFIPLGI